MQNVHFGLLDFHGECLHRGLVVQHLGGKVGVALLIHSATLKLPKMNKITCKLLPSGGNLEDDISILRNLPLQAKRAALGF